MENNISAQASPRCFLVELLLPTGGKWMEVFSQEENARGYAKDRETELHVTATVTPLYARVHQPDQAASQVWDEANPLVTVPGVKMEIKNDLKAAQASEVGIRDAGEIPDLATDELHRWEIEPHPITDFDVLVTNSDDEALSAILEVAESHLWDTNEPGQERVMKVRMNNVPAKAQSGLAQASVQDELEQLLDEAEAAMQTRFPYIADYDASNEIPVICPECSGAIDDHKANCIVPQLYFLSGELRKRIEQERQRNTRDALSQEVPQCS